MKTVNLYRSNFRAKDGSICFYGFVPEEFEIDDSSKYWVYRKHSQYGTFNVGENKLGEPTIDYFSKGVAEGYIYIRESDFKFSKDNILRYAKSEILAKCREYFGRW